MQKTEIIKNLSIPQKILIKNSKKNNSYPNLSNNKTTISDWFITEYVGYDENGILILVSTDTQHLQKIKENFYEIVQCSSNKSKELDLICRISYSNIKKIDWDGDNYENCPHIICDFNELDNTPYNDIFYAEEKKIKNGKIIYKKIVSSYNVISPLAIKNILKMYKQFNKDIIVDLHDEDYLQINNIYYEFLEKEIEKYQFKVNLRHGRVLSKNIGTTYNSSYNIDKKLCKLNFQNNTIVSDYFENRKEM